MYEIDLPGGGAIGERETGGGPNGLAEDAEGRIWVAQNGGRTLPNRTGRPTAPGLQVLDVSCDVGYVVEGFEAPNDLVVGPDGRVWFTDPGVTDDHPGRLHVYNPRTATTTTVAADLRYPNGLAFSPEGNLVVAETRSGALLRCAAEAGELGDARLFAELPAGGADGLAFAADGRLFAAVPTENRIDVFALDGRRLAPIEFGTPTFPTNLCFAGPALDVLIVTAAKGGRVLALEDVGVGLPLPAHAAHT
ncbi:SMP-30/gluconolactonase/LRE family protein [Pseudonocardia dioxanivorans]|uniref:SMP-30/gluconolactonase/LRE family protein n=1 Tax=Pseudonocardia dioxanivorans TaxID=240495 RepID=UPI002D795064|nr:SMP-30/gluconolactonase/LRE family protein [Pseudonocardia dioxanivorans]